MFPDEGYRTEIVSPGLYVVSAEPADANDGIKKESMIIKMITWRNFKTIDAPLQRR
jgi:hypothetical protein